MAQLFKDPDHCRRWRGYWIYFYAKEHIPPENKPLDWIHLHFKGQTGEIELYLKNGYPHYRIERQWGKIAEEEKTLTRKFVNANYRDIVAKIQKELKDRGVEWDGTFKK